MYFIKLTDAMGHRLTRVIDRNGKATVYEYDSLGNKAAVRYANGDIYLNTSIFVHFPYDKLPFNKSKKIKAK